MKASTPVEAHDPCLPIQADLSAMLDGELDAAVVRRVMVHSDACPSCRAFLDGIRRQAQAHRQLAACAMIDSFRGGDDDVGSSLEDPAARDLRRRLLENRRQLAKILYELGRGFVLMGVSPSFSRIVSREPVPVPDICLRGRNLLDEVERLNSRQQLHIGQEWVRAKLLFSEREMRDPVLNLARGRRLLREALMLREDFHEARIYLGHAYQVEGKLDRAVDQFGTVLDSGKDPVVRAFALENLGNLYLELERFEDAAALFHELVDSGIIDTEPRFYTTYFNMALVYGLMRRFDECEQWLAVLDERFPHRRRFIAGEIAKRQHFSRVLAAAPAVRRHFAQAFPAWFASLAGAESSEGNS